MTSARAREQGRRSARSKPQRHEALKGRCKGRNDAATERRALRRTEKFSWGRIGIPEVVSGKRLGLFFEVEIDYYVRIVRGLTRHSDGWF